MRRNEILYSMEKNLSGLQMTAAHRNQIRMRIQEEEKMKKKMPVALVLALVMIFISVTALALSNWDKIKVYLQSVRYIHYEMMDWWALEDQMKLVEAMHNAGLDMDEEKYQRLQNNEITDEERERICGEIIAARYGENWQVVDIEKFEWPLDMRKQSEDAMREYDKWNDNVQDEWEKEHPYIDTTRTEFVSEEELKQIFLLNLSEYWKFDPESIAREKMLFTLYEDDGIYEAAYTIDQENPGAYLGSECEITMLQHMVEMHGQQSDFTFRLYTDLCGNEISVSCLPMEREMMDNLAIMLTEVYGFDYGSFDESLFVIRYYEDEQLWEATYTITEENPGEWAQTIDEIERGETKITVLEAIRRQEGNKDSFTFSCYYDRFNRYVSIEAVEEYGEYQEYRAAQEEIIHSARVTKEDAEEIALAALVKKYKIPEQEIAEFRIASTLYGNQDGSQEYYIEFTGYNYSEDLSRIWSYAARVNSENGEVIAAVSQDDWDQRTGRKLVPDQEDLEVGGHIWAHDMMDELRKAAGDDSGSNWNLCFNKDNEYFYAWSLEEKAALSQSMKPKVDAFLEENPDYAQYLLELGEGPVYYNVTRHVYGLPSEGAIDQDAAQALAREAILSQLQADKAYLDGAGVINIYFDITVPEKPLWKFFFNTINQAVYPEDPLGFFVSMDAYTGEIIQIYPRNVETNMIDLM